MDNQIEILSEDNKKNVYDNVHKTVVTVNPYIPQEEEESGLDVIVIHKYNEQGDPIPKEDPNKYHKGVGVMIGNGLILTSPKLVFGDNTAGYKLFDDDTFLDAQVLKMNQALDLVILKSKSKIENQIAKLENVAPICYGDTVFTFMYPHDYNYLFGIGHVGSPRIMRDPEIVYVSGAPIDESFNAFPDKVPMIQLENFHTINRSIGAPVFNARGNLIGIISCTERSYDYAVHLNTIKDFVKDVIDVDPKDKGKGEMVE